MRAIVITGVGGVEVLEIRDVPIPEPRGEHIRVRVRACGLNRADLMQARGKYPAPAGVPAKIPGLEYAGEVDAVGPDVTGPFKVGDRVFGIVGGGGQAEFVVTHERMAVAIPTNLDFVQAAAVPEVYLTAHDALTTQGNLAPGESILIQAVGSGVGTAALQIAHAMGCVTFGTARTAAKLDRAKELGLDVAIDTTRENFAEVVRRQTFGKGVRVVLDLMGALTWAGNIESLSNKGRLVLVGLLGGSQASINLMDIMRKRIAVVGTTLRARPLEEKILATRKFADSVIPWLERGTVGPVIDSTFAFQEFREAQERVESNATFGKVILKL